MKKDDIYRSQFRLPYSLYEKLKEAANKHNRSVNAELIYILEKSFEYTNKAKQLFNETAKNKIELSNAEVLKIISYQMEHFFKVMSDTVDSIEKENKEK